MSNTFFSDKQRWFYAASLAFAGIWLFITLTFAISDIQFVGFAAISDNGYNLLGGRSVLIAGDSDFMWAEILLCVASWLQIAVALFTVIIAVMSLFVFEWAVFKKLFKFLSFACVGLIALYLVEGVVFTIVFNNVNIAAGAYTVSFVPAIILGLFVAVFFLLRKTIFTGGFETCEFDETSKNRKTTVGAYKAAKSLLEELKDMKDKKLITEEEYAERRKKIIETI